MPSADKSRTQYTSADVKLIRKSTPFEKTPNPFWPEMVYVFPATPAEMYDWATLIFEASEFLDLFDED